MQLLADDLASAALKEHVVRHDHRSLARGFQDGIDVLDEIVGRNEEEVIVDPERLMGLSQLPEQEQGQGEVENIW